MFPDLGNIATAMKWAPKGDQIAVVTKSADLMVFDPRKQDAIIRTKAHTGPKAQKLAWVDNESLITVGFNKQSER